MRVGVDALFFGGVNRRRDTAGVVQRERKGWIGVEREGTQRGHLVTGKLRHKLGVAVGLGLGADF